MMRPADAPDPVDVHVGSQVRTRRLVAGMGQAELGRRIGVTFQQVQKYERGTNRVSASMLSRMAEALGCREQDFFPTADEPEGGPAPTLQAARAAAELTNLFGRVSRRRQDLLVQLAREFAAEQAAEA